MEFFAFADSRAGSHTVCRYRVRKATWDLDAWVVSDSHTPDAE
jgi:hypothetical protein